MWQKTLDPSAAAPAGTEDQTALSIHSPHPQASAESTDLGKLDGVIEKRVEQIAVGVTGECPLMHF